MKQQQSEFLNITESQLYQEKESLEQTLKVLTQEVEFLSKKNEEFLKDLKTKNFYQAYRQQNEELTKLREAHTVLINMIQSNEIVIQGKKVSAPQGSFSIGQSLIGKRNFSDLTHKSLTPIKRLITCTHGTSQKGKGSKALQQEPFETMESLKVSEIDEYLDAVLTKYKGTSQINFMEHPSAQQH